MKSKYKGVFRNKKGWQANTWIGNKIFYIGFYSSEVVAAIQRDLYLKKKFPFGNSKHDYNFPSCTIDQLLDLLLKEMK